MLMEEESCKNWKEKKEEIIFIWYKVALAYMLCFEAMKIPSYKTDTPMMLVLNLIMAMCWILSFFLAVCLVRKEKKYMFWGLLLLQIRLFLVQYPRNLDKEKFKEGDENIEEKLMADTRAIIAPYSIYTVITINTVFCMFLLQRNQHRVVFSAVTFMAAQLICFFDLPEGALLNFGTLF